ncbi:hypothetical protein BJV82DRAFT_708636 [Fennellomyces sp. T-0311]|nr:hypothetical protein BJV82DRAFT_708636 [Fennellomyces sp. T-0311]
MANVPQPIFNGFPDRTRNVTRNCSLKALTQPEYGFMQTEIRLIAEVNATRRQDAFNLVNLHMRRYLEGNFAVIPPIFNQTWWTWVYKLVGLHPQAENIPAFLATDNDLMGTFAVFQTCRIDQEANEAYYVPDTVNDGTLEATMAGNFARQAIQNFKEHLRGLQQHIAILWQAALEPRLNRMEAKRASAQLARAIVHHDPQPPADLLNLDIAEDYQMLRDVYEANLADVDLWLVYARHIDYAMCNRILNVSRWCLQAAEDLQAAKRWSLLPVAKHQVSNFLICTRTLCLILRRRAHNVENTPVPNVLRQANGQFMNLHALARLTGNPATQQLVWETIFNINHVQRHRWRLGDNLNDVVNLNAISFAFSMQSDGVKAHLLFEKPILLQIEPVVTSRAEIRRLPENLDLTAWTKGVYHLDKGPRGLNEARIENSRIVGLDPGVSSMITATSTQDEMPQPGLWQQEVEVRTRSYHARTQVFWEYQKEANNRTKYNIQDEYDQLAGNSSNVSAAADFEQHIRVMSRVRNRMRFFNAHFKHREIRATLASARQSANHHIMNQLLGLTPPFRPGTKMHHIHLSSKRMRKRWHRHRRQAARELSGWVRNENDTIIFWGDGEMPTLPYFAPIPHVGILLFVAKFALVILTGEFRTSQIHSGCDAQLVPIRGTYIRTPHRMKRKRVQTRIRRTRGRKVKTCVNMDGQRLHRQSLCTQGQQQGTELWSLKRCLNHEHDVVSACLL